MKEELNSENLEEIKVELSSSLRIYVEEHNFGGGEQKVGAQVPNDLLKAGGMILLLLALVLLNGLVGLIYLLVLLFSGSLFSMATLATIVWAFMAGPYAYFIVGSRYGLKKLVWELYSKALRPVIQKTINVLISKWLDEIGMQAANSPQEKEELTQKIKSYIDEVLNTVPAKFQAYFNIKRLSANIVDTVYTLASQDVISDEMIEEAGDQIFKDFDQQIEKVVNPSFVWIYLLFAVNILVWGFIWFGL